VKPKRYLNDPPRGKPATRVYLDVTQITAATLGSGSIILFALDSAGMTWWREVSTLSVESGRDASPWRIVTNEADPTPEGGT